MTNKLRTAKATMRLPATLRDTASPGPWSVRTVGLGVEIVDAGGVLIARVIGTDGEARANAAILSAATDMLDALKDTLDFWTVAEFAKCDPGCHCIVDSVRGAIAKAEVLS